MKPTRANLAASVRQRLYNLAKSRNVDFQRLLTQYALERLMYRISKSEYADRFIVKGAMLFLVWSDEPLRTTRDLDLLGTGDPEPDAMLQVFQAVIRLNVPPDGLLFLSESVSTKRIREQNSYGGVRVNLKSQLEGALINLQIDIGFGDVLIPGPQEIDFPTLLKFPAPRLRAYTRETVIAEKASALIGIGFENTRMKDFFDLWILSMNFSYTGTELRASLAATMTRRSINVPDGIPAGLSDAFANDPSKKNQWSAFVRQNVLSDTSSVMLDRVIAGLRSFLQPILDSIRLESAFHANWTSGGPWQEDVDDPKD